MAELPALSVWASAQQTAASQRRGRYVDGAMAHPAKMTPAIARAAIAAYSRPGDLVVDPMCGIGHNACRGAAPRKAGLGRGAR